LAEWRVEPILNLDKFQFQHWALSLIGARSLEEGEGKRADRGDMNIQKTAGGILLMREKPPMRDEAGRGPLRIEALVICNSRIEAG
jgi:hypothetical protein